MFEILDNILATVLIPFIFEALIYVGVAYAAYWIAAQFGSGKDITAPNYGNYPLQTAMKGGPIPKIYGTERIATNVIWLGELHPYTVKHDTGGGKGGSGAGDVEETRYRRSFLLAVCEGPATIIRAWKGKEEISLSEFTRFDGDDNAGIRALTGEDYGDWPNLCCAFFDEYELGNAETIPNFTFEVASSIEYYGYKFTYISEQYHIYGIPVFNGYIQTLTAGGEARDVGGGVVGLPFVDHPFEIGNTIIIEGTTAYDGVHVLTSGTSENELQFTETYSPETFDGTETVIKDIDMTAAGPSIGRIAYDNDGNLYYGISWKNSSGIVKVDVDENWSYDDFDWPRAYTSVKSLVADDAYLYVLMSAPDYVLKFQISDGSLVWESINQSMGYEIANDENGNAYCSINNPSGAIGGAIYKLDADTGVETELTDMGRTDTSNVLGAQYDVIVDDNLGIVIAGGQRYCLTSQFETYEHLMVNLWVRTLDNIAGDTVLVKGTFSNSLTKTYLIGTGCIAVHDDYIYVLIPISGEDPGEVYKYRWNGTSLEFIKMFYVCPYAIGLYFDLWGNLVIVNKFYSETNQDILYYYDTDGNLKSYIDHLPEGILDNWDAPAGGSWMQGDALFYPPESMWSHEAGDMNPADIIEDIIENSRYGAGDTSIIDATSLATARADWADLDYLLSMKLDSQKPWLDWVDYILAHCGGYRFKSQGKMHFGVLKNETPVDNITADDFVREKAEPAVNITKRPRKETSNRIIVGYTNRDKRYEMDYVTAEDRVDQRRFGVRENIVKLEGIHNKEMAQQIAYRMLIDALYRFNVYKFKLTFNKLLLDKADVITLTDGELLDSQRVRIMNIVEAENCRDREVTAMDDLIIHYPDLTGFEAQESLHTPDPAITLTDAEIYFREDVSTNKIYLSVVPGSAYFNGALIYRSYDDSSYQLVGRIGVDGVTGGDANSAGTTQGSLPAHGSMTWAPDESVLVSIGTVTDLRTSITEDQFWHDQYLSRIGDEIIAFKMAEETATPGIWRISNLRRGLFGTEPVAHSPGEDFCTLDTSFTYTYEPANIGQTLYFKAVVYYGNNYQDISDLSGYSVTIGGYYIRPAAASLLRLASDENDGGSGEYSGSSFTLYWNLGSRISGYNYGGYDVSGGGVPYNNYTADGEMQAINLEFEETDGTPISNRSIAVASSETISKATDLGGNNDAVCKVITRRVYQSRLENSLEVSAV